jgi:hypothetical protein
MKPENKKFLEEHRDVYEQIIRSQTAKKARAIARDLHRIMQEEFIPGYVYETGCGSCLFNMVPLLYKKFDEWKAANPDIPEQVSGSAPEIPLIVAASFPHQKPEQTVFYKGDPAAAPVSLHKHKHRRR